MTTSLAAAIDIHSTYPLTEQQIAFYREHEYIKLKQVLSPEVISHYQQEIARKVRELSTETLPLEKRSTYGKAFLQVTNLWTHSEIVKEFVMGRRLAKIATQLMNALLRPCQMLNFFISGMLKSLLI